jgi:predicted component of type VI protein secretion system
MLRKQSLFIVRTIRNTHYVERIQSFSMLKQAVHIEPLGIKGFMGFSVKVGRHIRGVYEKYEPRIHGATPITVAARSKV